VTVHTEQTPNAWVHPARVITTLPGVEIGKAVGITNVMVIMTFDAEISALLSVICAVIRSTIFGNVPAEPAVLISDRALLFVAQTTFVIAACVAVADGFVIPLTVNEIRALRGYVAVPVRTTVNTGPLPGDIVAVPAALLAGALNATVQLGHAIAALPVIVIINRPLAGTVTIGVNVTDITTPVPLLALLLNVIAGLG